MINSQSARMSYASYAASIEVESPFRLYSQTSFSSDLKIGAEKPTHQLFQCQQLFQSQQQQSQRQHLIQQHMSSSKLQQHGSQQLQRFRIKWPLVLGALLVAVFVAAALMFTPLGWPVLPHPTHTAVSSSVAVRLLCHSPLSNWLVCVLCGCPIRVTPLTHPSVTVRLLSPHS